MPSEIKISSYAEPTAEQIAARKKRNYAIGAILLAFCIFIFALMLTRFGGGG